MLKGVNKQILEVTNTDSPYFEKIIFFVRPASQGLDEKKLKTEAEKISASTATRPPRQRRDAKMLMSISCCSCISIVTGAALTVILNHFHIF